MDNDMIEQLVRGIEDDSQDTGEPIEYVCRRQLKVFAQRVAEECAKLCEQHAERRGVGCAAAIRAKFTPTNGV